MKNSNNFGNFNISLGYRCIDIYSHVVEEKDRLVLENKDVYDSRIVMIDNGREVFVSNLCNVDSSNNLKYKVEIEDGEYGGIVGYHRGKYLAVFLFDISYFDKISRVEDFNLRDNYKSRILKSKYPNPVHGGKHIVVGVNIHRGGSSWDWSLGCITIYGKDYDNFLNFLRYNDKYIVRKR